MDSSPIAGFVLLAFALFVYFIPSIAAKGKNRAGAIFALNLFLGWTLVGWVVALVWALAEQEPDALPDERTLDALIRNLASRDAWVNVRPQQAVLLTQEGGRWLAATESGPLGYLGETAAAKVTFRQKAIGAPLCRVREVTHEGVVVTITFSAAGAHHDRLTQATGAAHSTS